MLKNVLSLINQTFIIILMIIIMLFVAVPAVTAATAKIKMKKGLLYLLIIKINQLKKY